MKRLILIIVVMVSCATGLKAQLLALKTDVLWDGLMTPNFRRLSCNSMNFSCASWRGL